MYRIKFYVTFKIELVVWVYNQTHIQYTTDPMIISLRQLSFGTWRIYVSKNFDIF